MLQSVVRTAKYGLTNKYICQNLHPVLGTTGHIRNFRTSPVAWYETNLPKLVLPPLADTLEKYLQSLIPILTEEELCCTVKLTKEFGKKDGCGEMLQGFLEERKKNTENWLEKWWLNTYLGFRVSVVVNSSPGFVFPLQDFCSKDDQLCYAAKIIVACMKYKELIEKEKIPQDLMGKAPLDMQQYKKFFGTNRRPCIPSDILEYNPKSTHIVIACNNNFFKLYPVNKKGEILSTKQLLHLLKNVICCSETRADAVGILSSNNRDKWTCDLQQLTKDTTNAKSVAVIEKALFLVCLDAEAPDLSGQNRLTKAGHQTIHGCGSMFSSGNRWFDKTAQFVISEDGIVGMTYEHSPAEGQPIALMKDFIDKQMIENDPGCDVSGTRDIEPLCFNITPQIKTAIKNARAAMDCLIQNLDLQCTVYKKYGKKFIKAQKFSPDAYVQMAMQLAYYRVHKKPAAQYESAATRMFKGGRTETIRSCSVESVKFAKCMLDCGVSPIDKRNYLTAAIAAQKKYTLMALQGLGVDRHLMGLKLVAEEKCIPEPDFFKDKGYIRSRHFNVTSSQVATKSDGFMCYGATEEDGYAFCYNPREDNIQYAISCYNSEKSTNAMKMKKAIDQSLDDMLDILCKSQPSKL